MTYEIHGANCLTPNGMHELVEAKAPYILQCGVCGERFYLISETALREAGLENVRPRRARVNPRH